MINAYELDRYNYQLRKVDCSREFNRIIAVIEFIGSLSSLRNQRWKTVCWFFMRSSNNIIVEVGHYNSPSNSHFPVRHQLIRSIVKLFGFYPSMAQDMQSGFFRRKQRATIWEQHKQHWNQASPERIRYGHQDTVKALNRGLKGNDNKSYNEIKTKEKLQNPKRQSESRLVRRYSSTEAAQRINKLRYVEVENCRINRKLVSSLPNSTHQNFIKDISERGECWIISSILISHLRYKVVPGM